MRRSKQFLLVAIMVLVCATVLNRYAASNEQQPFTKVQVLDWQKFNEVGLPW